VTSLQVGLAYVLQQAFPVVALVGPTTAANLNEALGALNVGLNREEIGFLVETR
jgi:aryl-alcohol dehydrogenase-like predicted oxidoreductase